MVKSVEGLVERIVAVAGEAWDTFGIFENIKSSCARDVSPASRLML